MRRQVNRAFRGQAHRPDFTITRSFWAALWLCVAVVISGCNSSDSSSEASGPCDRWYNKNAPKCSAPPARIQSLSAPKWENNNYTSDSNGAIDDAFSREPTPTPEPEPTPRYKGVMANALEVWEETGHQARRSRAIQRAFAQLTEQDVQESLTAILSGRRLDAEVAMALLTLRYTADGEWRLLEEAYRQLFRSVPELASNPAYLLEHAVSLLKLENYRASLAEARVAETYFRALPAGQLTLEHRARLAECRAWASEGLSRQSEATGVSDEELRELDMLALRAWDEYIALLQKSPKNTPNLEERLRISRDHRSYLNDSLEVAGGK